MTVIRPNSISGVTSITAQTNALNFYDSAGATLSIGASVTGDITGNLTGNVTGDVNAGVITATTITGVSTIGVTTVTATNLTVNGNAYPSAGPLSNRNKIINGDMRIDQRNNGSAVTVNTTSFFFPVDRFWGYGGTPGVYTLEQVEDAPAGFRHSIKGQVTTIDTSIGASTIYVLEYRVEGYDMQDLEWGTADAKTITLSFWVKVSQAGTYTGAVHNNAQNRSYGFTWTVSTTDWEYKTITIPGDTSGTWVQTNLTGMSIVLFALGVGSTFESANSNQWESRTTFAVSGNTYLIGTLNSTFNITGVQLEVGTVATPFEHRSYGDELARCQRYYYKEPSLHYHPTMIDGTGAYLDAWVYHPVEMRATPTTIFENISSFYYNDGTGEASLTPTGGTTGYSGNTRMGYSVKQNIDQNLGSSNKQKVGQWRVQLSFSSEL